MVDVAITRIGQLWIEYLVGGLIDDVRELPCRPFERQGCSLVRDVSRRRNGFSRRSSTALDLDAFYLCLRLGCLGQLYCQDAVLKRGLGLRAFYSRR
jgi:hypothetical protein